MFHETEIRRRGDRQTDRQRQGARQRQRETEKKEEEEEEEQQQQKQTVHFRQLSLLSSTQSEHWGICLHENYIHIAILSKLVDFHTSLPLTLVKQHLQNRDLLFSFVRLLSSRRCAKFEA